MTRETDHSTEADFSFRLDYLGARDPRRLAPALNVLGTPLRRNVENLWAITERQTWYRDKILRYKTNPTLEERLAMFSEGLVG